MQDKSSVKVGIIDDNFLVKVEGKGTVEYCSDLFEYINMKLEVKKIINVYFDLSECFYMDSSFIGLIVSIRKKVKKLKMGQVIILNPTQKVFDIIKTMGLAEILKIQRGENEFKNIDLDESVRKKLEKNYHDIQLVLESHQNLMEINLENKKRFALVEEMLMKELKDKEKDQ